jgi:hypothetical protein
VFFLLEQKTGEEKFTQGPGKYYYNYRKKRSPYHFFFFILKRTMKRNTHQDQVSIIDITEERRREALNRTSVFFIITEDRRREAFTRTR